MGTTNRKEIVSCSARLDTRSQARTQMLKSTGEAKFLLRKKNISVSLAGDCVPRKLDRLKTQRQALRLETLAL